LEKQNNSNPNGILQNASELTNISTSNTSQTSTITQDSNLPLINRINVLEVNFDFLLEYFSKQKFL